MVKTSIECFCFLLFINAFQNYRSLLQRDLEEHKKISNILFLKLIKLLCSIRLPLERTDSKYLTLNTKIKPEMDPIYFQYSCWLILSKYVLCIHRTLKI